MPYSVDDIKKLRAGYKNKEKESPVRDSSSYSVEDISKMRSQYNAMNRPKEIEASTSVKPANNVTAPVTYEATQPETAQPEFRFNSTEEYDKAINDLGMTFGEKVGYKAKGLLNGLLDLTADARLNSPSITNSPTLSQSAIVTNVPYSEKEKEYSALQSEKGRFSADNVFQEFETKYPNYKENMDTNRTVYMPTDARDLFLYTTRMSTDPNYWNVLIGNMTDEEVAMGNQIMASEGSEAYWDYMGKMDTYISKRMYDAKTDVMDKWANNPDDSGLAEFGKKAYLTVDRTLNNGAGTLGTGLEYVESLIAGADPNPYSGYSGLSNLAQDESEIVTKGMGETGAFIYNTANSIVDSAIGAAMFGKSYSVLMGSNAFNTTYRDLKEKGASNEDIITGALLSGAAEAVFEEVSLDRLLTPKNIKSKKLLVKEALLQSGVEASEEVCTEIANIITEEMNQGANSDTAQMIEQMREAGYSEEEIKREIGNNVSKRINMAALGGALSGLVMGGAWGGADFYQNRQIGKGVNRDSFSDVSKKYDDGSDYGVEISELKSKYGDEWSTKASDAEIGSAYRTAMNNLAYTLAEETNKSYNADEIKSKLTKLSDERADLQTLLDSENSVDSETDEHKEKIAQLEKGIADIDSRYEALQNQLSGASFKRTQNLYTDTLLSQKGATLKTNNDLNVGTKTSYKGMDDLKITGVKSDNGKITLVTNKGELDAKSKDVVLSNNMAQVVTIASNMDNQRKANALVANYNGQDVQDYITASQLAWTYGYNKNDELGMEQLAEDLPNLSISQEDVINIYEAGLSAKNAELNEASKANEEIKKKYSGEFKAGTFKADGIDLAKLTSTERVVYFMAQSFSEMGINIELFRDVRATSKNGSYDKNNNVVRINLAARYYTNNGIFDRRYAINTMAHELTHWMEVNSAKEYASLKAMVWKYYASIGVDVEKLIAEEKPEKIGRKAAESEVMARACEDMFNNPATFAQITKDADAKTMGKIKTAIAKAFDKIMDFLSRMMKGYGSNSTAATLIRQNQEVFEQLRKQWTATFEAGLEFNQAYNEAITPADDIDVKNSDKVTMEESVEGVAGKLMAYHNLDESSLMKAIELGGFPMPSIAIKLAEVGHADYGDISVIFFPNTIDPQSNKYNDVFSGDAWTPVFPSVDVKIDSKVLKSIQDKVIKLVGGAETYYKMGGANLDISNAEDLFNRNRDVTRTYGDSNTLKYAFLKDTGKAFDIPMKEKKLHPDLPNEDIGAMAKVIGKEALDDANNNGYQWMKDNKDIVDRIRLLANEASLRNYDAQVANGAKKEHAKLREFYATQFDTDGELSFSDFDKLMRAMRQSFGEVEQVVDTAKYEELLDKNVDKDEYDKWLNELFDGIIEKEGIRNNADYFTSSGNRRSWDALHWELTLENVVRAMRQQEKQGSAGFLGGQNIWGVATKRYKSISEMRKDIARLVHQNEEERDAQRAEFTERLLAITDEIMYKGKGTNPFIEHDHAAEAIVDSLRGPKTVKAIEKSLREWTTLNIKDDTAQKILDLYNEIMVMPTDYFEAKPARAVGFDEIAYVVIPSNSSKELKDALTKEGIDYHEYEKSDDNADRIKVTNEAAVDSDEEVLFSLKVADETHYMSQDKLNFTTNTDAVRSCINRGQFVVTDTGEGVASTDLGIIYFGGTSKNINVNRVVKIVEIYKDSNNRIDLRKDVQAQEIWLDAEDNIKNGRAIKENIFVATIREAMSRVRNGDVRIVEYSGGNHIPYRGNGRAVRRNGQDVMEALERDALYRGVYDKGLADAGDKNQLAIKELIANNTGVDKSLFSNKVDSDGNRLSVGQDDYFQDSKVRDSEGNLLKVYHGTPAKGFTVFRGPLNYYTADRNYAERYTNTSASDTKKTAGEAGVYEGYLNIVNPFDLSDAKTRKIFVDEYIKGGYAQGINPMASKAEIDAILARGIDWVEADNLKDFIDDKEYDYDGIILNEGGDIVDGKSVMRGNSFVTFNSNQFKDIDNLNPTDAEDIYYSEKVTDKKTLDYIDKPSGKLGFTNERIDKLLSGGYYGSTNPNYAQAYIAYMSPEDFLKLTTGKNQRALERVKKWGSDEPFDLDKMAEQFNYVPLQLNIDEENNEVIGHEGRHRMAQLSQMGYKQVPVLLFNYDNKYSKQSITSIDLMPQWFQELDDSLNDSDRVTVKDLIPFSQGNADIIKERFGEGQKDATLFSDKIDDDIMDMFDFDMNGFEKTMKADVKRLTESMVKSVSEGQNMTDKQLNLIARTLLKESGSTYGIKDLTADLKEVYEYILDNVWMGQLDWEVMMAKAYDTAQKIMNEVKATNIDDYYKGILDDIRKSRVQLNDTQIQEAKSILGGGNYRNLFMGKVILAKDGVMLDQKWQSWAGKYPGVFKADINPNDQVRELLEVYNTVKDLSTKVQTFNDTQSVMSMAEEIYQKFWNVFVVSKKEMDDTVKKLNSDHKKAMDKLKSSRDEAINKIKLADAMYYGRKINELRNRKDKELQDYKDYKKKKAEERKELVQRRATINDITDTAKTLMSWLKENGTKHRVPDVLKGSVLNLLDAIDFSSRRLLGLVGGKDTFVPTKKDISMGKAMENVRDIVRKAMKAQTDGEASDEFLGYIDFPPQFDEDLNDITNSINDIERRTKDSAYVLEEMSLDDLLSLKEALKIMKHSVSKMNSIISSTNAHSCDYYSQDTIKTAKEFGEKKNGGNVVVNVVGNFFNFNNALPVYVFKRFGKGAQEIFRLLQNGWDKFAFNINTIKEFADKAYTDEEVNQWTKEVHEVTVLEVPTDAEREQGKENSERDIKLTTAQIMSLYCLSKREQARGHILGGGIRIADFKENWSTIVQSKAVTLTESELVRITGMLTERQREVADKLQEFMNTTCSDWGNEVTMKRFGIRAFTEENYFPIKSDSNVLRADVRDDAQSIYALLNMSFTKSLVKKANNQIVVDDIFNVFTVHTSDMAKYNSIALPVLDTIKWWNYKEKEERGGQQFTTNSVKSELETAYGKGANKYVRNLLSDLNGNAESGRYDGPIRRFTKRYKVAAVGANLSVALLQPISFFRATYAIDEKYLAKALTKKPSIEKCKKYCGVALWKSLGFYDTNVSRGLDSIIKHSNTIKDKATDYSLRLAELGDSITWGYLWNACEAEIMDTRNLKYGSEEFNEAVALRLRDILYETQVFDSTMSRSDIMRAKGAAQDLTAFMSEPTVTTNMMYDAGVNFQREASRKGFHSAMQNYGKSVAKACEAYAITALLEAIVRGVLDKLRDTDDDSIVELFVKEFKDALNPLSKIPVVKEIVSMFQGYDPTRMELAGLGSAVNTVVSYTKIISGDKDWTYKTTYQTLQSIGQLTGLPLSNAMREIATLWNNTIGKMYPSLTLKK